MSLTLEQANDFSAMMMNLRTADEHAVRNPEGRTPTCVECFWVVV